jgi:beta-glucosidase
MLCRRFVLSTACVAFAVTLSLSALSARGGADAEKMPDTVVPLSRDVPRHHKINERAKQGDVDLLFIGDSITQGWEGSGKEVWKMRYEPRKAMNAGIGGDRTQHVLWRLDNGNIDGLSPKLAVLMIGTNNFGTNTAEDIALGIKAIVTKLRTKLPKTKVLVLAVFPRGEQPDDPLRKKMAAINAVIKDIGDGKMIHYLDINDKLLNEDGRQNRELMPDFVHLTARAYQIWGEAIEPKVAELMAAE